MLSCLLHASCRQDPELSRLTARYIRLTTPALWAMGAFEACKRYLMAQGVVRPQSAITLLCLALAPFYSWFLIFRLKWGLDGSALSVVAIRVRRTCWAVESWRGGWGKGGVGVGSPQ